MMRCILRIQFLLGLAGIYHRLLQGDQDTSLVLTEYVASVGCAELSRVYAPNLRYRTDLGSAFRDSGYARLCQWGCLEHRGMS
jgi:hypothetical protein